MRSFVFFLCALFLLTNCSIQKRKYQKGFYVNWHKASPVQEKNAVARHGKKTVDLPPLTIEKQDDALLAFAGNAASPAQIKHLVVSKKADPDSCDEISFRSGNVEKAKILEITTSEIKYKRCSMPDGPLFVIKKSEVFMIRYRNGTSEVFKAEPVLQNYATAKPGTYNNPNARTNPFAVLSLVFGIAGIYPLFVIGGILALVFGTIALRQIRERPGVYKGEGLARTGKIFGIVSLSVIAAIVLIVLVIAALAI